MSSRETIIDSELAANSFGHMVAGRAFTVAGDVRHGMKELAHDVVNDTASTLRHVLRDTGVLPQPTIAEAYRSRLEFFEATIRARVPFMEDELQACSNDFVAPNHDAREKQILYKVKDSLGFSDGLQWLKLARQEESPGPHVDMADWTHGRLDDYSAMLIKFGLSVEASQMIDIGLRAHFRHVDEPVTTDSGLSQTMMLSDDRDLMRC